MSFPRYERYKESGVEWLGEVPEGWEVKALKRGYSVRLGKMLQPGSSSPDDELLPYLRASNIQWTGVDLSDLKLMWFSPAEKQQLTLQYGDLLVSEGGDVGRSALWLEEMQDCFFQNAINRVRAKQGNSTGYLYYWMAVIKDKGYIDVLCNKSTIAHFTAEKVQTVPVPFPPLPEQHTIAAFLDRETGKIDELVTEQERLIALLKEKRQAVISHAVTKGLNPDAPMKDSGIEWLGEVPEGWSRPYKLLELAESARNSFVNGPFGSDLLSTELRPEGVPVIYIRDLKEVGYKRKSEVCVSEEKAEQIKFCNVIKGDVLVAKVGDPPGLSVVYPECEPEGIVTQDVIRLRTNRQIAEPAFIMYLLNSDFGRALIDNISVESTRIRIGLGEFKQQRVVLPSAIEQKGIIAFLDNEIVKIETLVNEAQQAIDLLKERRSALISAAVTGKIDVRGVVS